MRSATDNPSDVLISLPELGSSAWRRKWLLMFPLLACIGVGVVYVIYATPIYEVRTSLVVKQGDASARRFDPDFLTAQAEMLSSALLIQKAVDSIDVPCEFPPDVDPVRHLQTALSLETIRDADVIRIAFRCQDASRGEAVVKALLQSYKELTDAENARVFEGSDEIRRMEAELRIAEAAREELKQKLGPRHTGLRAAEAKVSHLSNALQDERAAYRSRAAEGLRVIDGPVGSTEPVWPQPIMILAISVGLGLAVSLALLVWLADADRTLITPHQLRHDLEMPILGFIPPIRTPLIKRKKAVYRGRLVSHSPNSPAAEVFRTIRTRMMITPDSGSVIQVVSATSGEGKTMSTSNLAISCAQLGKRVIVVDADLRCGIQHKIFGVSGCRGLSSILAEGMPVEDAIQRSPHTAVDVLSRGPKNGNAGELLAQPEYPKVLEILRSDYDFILVDSPPLLVVADGAVCASCADGVVLTVRSGRSTLGTCGRALELLDSVGAHTAGAVINGIRSRELRRSQYRYYRGTGKSTRVASMPDSIRSDVAAKRHVKKDEPIRQFAGAGVRAAPEMVPSGPIDHGASERHNIETSNNNGQRNGNKPIVRSQSVSRSSARRVSGRVWHRRLVTYASWLYLLLVILTLVAVRVISEQWWFSTVITYMPRPLLLAPVLVLFPLAALWSRRALAMILLATVLVLGPLMDLRVPWGRVLDPTPVSEDVLRLVSCNVAEFRFDWTELLNEIVSYDPDIIVIQESTPQIPENFRNKFRDWHCVETGPHWVAAKVPVKALETCRSEATGRQTAVRYQIDSGFGPVVLCNVHTISIRRALQDMDLSGVLDGSARRAMAELTSLRDAEAKETNRFVRDGGSGGPLIVVGDFNMTSTSSLYEEHWSDLRNAFDCAGLGYGYTAPCVVRGSSKGILPWLRIDHVLVNGDWDVLECEVGQQPGSDHRLIFAAIAPRPSLIRSRTGTASANAPTKTSLEASRASAHAAPLDASQRSSHQQKTRGAI